MKELSIEEKAKLYDEAKINGSRLWECGEITRTNYEFIFPELKESEDERIRETLIENFKWFCGDYPETTKWGKDDNLLVKDIIAWLEKQGEQKSANKIEPKFKVGDWVVYKNDVCQIVKREEGCNKLVTIFGIEKELVNERNLSTARLWTIQDAKDGDVLYCKSNDIEYIVMSKGVNKHGNIDSYFRYNSLDGFGIDIPSVLSTRQDDITPATKEQRELLFQKMKESGYKWNADKKELKKIEQNLTLNEIQAKQITPEESLGISSKEWNDIVDECIYGEQKPAWSEEDREMRMKVLKYLSTRCNVFEYEEVENWLKSLKTRYPWKPSELQVEALESATENCAYSEYQDCLKELVEQLKKLREG